MFYEELGIGLVEEKIEFAAEGVNCVKVAYFTDEEMLDKGFGELVIVKNNERVRFGLIREGVNVDDVLPFEVDIDRVKSYLENKMKGNEESVDLRLMGENYVADIILNSGNKKAAVMFPTVKDSEEEARVFFCDYKKFIESFERLFGINCSL